MESISFADAFAKVSALRTSPHESSLLLLGEHGLGKSHLLDRLQATHMPDTVLVRAHPAEAGFPLAGFDSLFTALRHEQASELARFFSLRSTAPDGLFAAAHDLLTLIQGLRLPPTLALIDDIDRMDIPSQVLLATISPRLAGTSLWIVATATEVDPRDIQGSIPVARLLPPSTDEIVEALGQSTPHDESTLRILAGYTGGNPRILSEQLAEMHADQLAGEAPLVLPPRVTPTVEQVTDTLLDNLGPALRPTLDRAALAPMSHLSALGSLTADGPDAVEDLIDAGLLHRQGAFVTVSDHRLRSRLYWDQGSKLRRERHAELADAVAPYDERLETWHRSSASGGPQSVDLLLSAACSLVREDRIGEAVEFAERALIRAVQIDDHAPQLIRLAGRLLNDGQLSLAARFSGRARFQTSAPAHALAILGIRLTAQLFQEQRLVDDEVLTLSALHADDDPDGAGNLLTLAALYRAERWEVEEARQLSDKALELDPLVTEPTRVKLRTMREIVDALEGRTSDVSDETPVPELDPMRMPPDLLLMRGRSMTWRENHTEARRLFTLIHNHRQERDRIWDDLATYAKIGNEISAGEFRLARVAIETWGTESPWINRGTSMHAFVRSWYAYSAGELDEASAHIDHCLELASREAAQSVRARALALRGSIHLLADDPEAAVMDLRQVSAISTRFRNPSLLRHWADYTEACVATERVQEASAAVAALERRLSAHSSRWGRLALLRCRALVEAGPSSIELYEDAIKEFERDELPYEHGRTLTCLADRQLALGMNVESRRTRIAAVAAFENAGADAWARHAGESEPTPAKPATTSLLDRLTPDEQEVATRVRQGLRNREIAQALFVSVRTVELRLTRIYRTLDVQSRSQLVAALSGSRPTDDSGDGAG